LLRKTLLALAAHRHGAAALHLPAASAHRFGHFGPQPLGPLGRSLGKMDYLTNWEPIERLSFGFRISILGPLWYFVPVAWAQPDPERTWPNTKFEPSWNVRLTNCRKRFEPCW